MNFLTFLSISFLLVLLACQKPDHSKTIATTETGSRIEVIDFYSTHRCKTCLKIEDNTRKLLQSAFAKEMESGILSFQTVNVDEAENYEIAKRFEAAGTALFVNVIKNGQEQHIDLTNFAFMKAFDEQAFNDTLKTRISEQLERL
ncbi:MAG: hypothetical protein D6730_04565 [Bacteroidetes bacterium]|nr:MAG: hypothetical protein D6730_04565 [Bacteroidota bacterium]